MKQQQLLAIAIGAFALSSANAAIKYWDNPAYRAFDVDCYVPGTVWNYYGIRNQGATAAHDNDATTWVNLGSNTGFGGDSSLSKISIGSGGDGEWTDDGYIFNGGTRWKGSAKVTVAGDFTVQMLVDADAAEQINTTGFAPACSVMLDNFAFGIYSKGSFIFRVNGDNNGPKITTESGKYDYANVIRDDANRKAYLFSGTEMPESGEGYRQYATAIGSKSTTGYGLGSTSNSGQQFVGKLKFFRLYQGILSSEQLAWNRVVDERRFFDRAAPLPITNAVVATSVAASVEPAGTYAVDGRHIFTAPRVATVGNTKYICTGCTLEEWDDATGDWGSATFHARELSCKVEDTDCVRITWKWADADGLATYDVSDYVWNGLEVFYDGICNVGTNAAHDATALTWKNLGSKGAPNDMFLQLLNAGGTAWTTAANLDKVGDRDPGAWTADGFALEGDSRFRCNSATDNKIIVGTDYSLQMLLDANAAAQKDSSAFLFSLNANNFSLGLYKSGSIKWRNDSDPWNSSADDRALIMTGTEFGYLTAIMDSEALTTTLFSGTARPTSGTGYHTHDTLKGHSEGGYDLGGYGNNNYDKLLVGTLKSFRQYDHALTPAEVLQNRKVDDFRYFGKFAETDVIVQSTYAALQGNEPDGEYDVDGSHTFTAPASVAIKVNGREIEYACAGYTVERGYWKTRASTTFFVCTNTQTVVENSHTYDESSGLVRLTWLWKPVRGLRTAADYGYDDYSQAGLVWNYDGIYNAGVGVHNPGATTWKNLGDRANSDLHWNNQTSTGHWADNGYVFAGGPRFKGNAGFCLRNCTMQTLIDGNPADQTVVEPYSFNGSGNYFNFRLIKDSYNGPAANSFCWDAQNGTRLFFHAPGNQYGFATGIQDFDNKKAMMFPDTTIPAEYVADGTYGAQRLYNEFASMTEVIDDGYGLGNIKDGSAGFVGTVKFFRYYDRVLTEDELVRNRNADAVRYFGELGVTNVVVAVEDGCGISAAEATDTPYCVEGEYTFSATGAKGLGYRLLVPNGNGGWRTYRTFTEGDSYTYTAGGDTPALVKLEWCAIKPTLILIK